MNTWFEKIKQSKMIDILKNVLSSKFFPFVTAALFLLCYLTGLDLLAIYYLAFVAILILLLFEDISPIIPQLPFICLVVSIKNSPYPGFGGSDFYTSTAVLVQAGIIVALAVAALVYRIVVCFVKKKFKTSPVFYGLAAFCFILLLNGIFNENYTVKNLLYGLMMALCFFGVYVLFKDNINTDKNCFERIAYGFIALSALLILHLIIAYSTIEGLIVDGVIIRTNLIFSWGNYNNYGLMILICLPAPIYLAATQKHGYIFTAYSALIFTATLLSCSRQAMLFTIFFYPACLIYLIVKGKYRLQNSCIAGAILLAGIVLICIFREQIAETFTAIFSNIVVDGELNGSGRWKLWKESMQFFADYPIFGAGFFVSRSYDTFEFLELVPLMSHNTVCQLLSSCGMVGLIAYTVHRIQTIICYFKNITTERTFAAVIIAIILILSLVDMHIFNIYATIIYGSLLAVLEKSQDMKKS